MCHCWISISYRKVTTVDCRGCSWVGGYLSSQCAENLQGPWTLEGVKAIVRHQLNFPSLQQSGLALSCGKQSITLTIAWAVWVFPVSPLAFAHSLVECCCCCSKVFELYSGDQFSVKLITVDVSSDSVVFSSVSLRWGGLSHWSHVLWLWLFLALWSPA